MQNQNAISVDVEDYYHVSAFSDTIDRNEWNGYESRVEKNTHKLLDLFDGKGVKGTFFVLGWVAERNKSLIEEIFKRGHEVACHGYSHQLIYNQTPEEFRDETVRSKGILEDIIQSPVIGYRAASYSITNKSLWALDILAECGFVYDSSIFPVQHDRYGIPGAKDEPNTMSLPSGRTLVEFPLSTLKLFGYRLPVAGGGYFRLYPYGFTRYALNRVSSNGKPFVFYIHPWEVDPEQPRVSAGLLSRFRHYNNLNKCESRFACLLNDFNFTTLKDVLVDLKLLTA